MFSVTCRVANHVAIEAYVTEVQNYFLNFLRLASLVVQNNKGFSILSITSFQRTVPTHQLSPPFAEANGELGRESYYTHILLRVNLFLTP
jgi:hypothetical protein